MTFRDPQIPASDERSGWFSRRKDRKAHVKISSGMLATTLLSVALFGAVSYAQDATAPRTQDAPVAGQAGEKAETGTERPQTDAAPAAAAGVRIVRLSQVRGKVQLDRNTEHGFEAAFPNLPITQGQRLAAGEGVAEVEFEDNSTLRVTPDSLIEFPALQRGPSGATISRVKLVKGTLYVSLANTKGNEFEVVLGSNTISLAPSSHIRLEAGAPTAKLTVMNGSVQVQSATAGIVTVGKNKQLSFDPANGTPPVLAKKEGEGPFDEWDKTSADYHKLRSIPAAFGGSSYAYGINDMNYYGGFSNVGGCGSMWRPYFASAAWDPYANGSWAWYPGAGYSWVSPYPWGWTPFHSGSWQYCGGGAGWGWRPGGQWNGLTNQPAIQRPMPLSTWQGTGPRPTHGVPRPPNPPSPGHATVVVVSTTPLTVSRPTSPGNFTFRNDSAGLGVPRGSFGRLDKVSAGVERSGAVSKAVPEPVSQGARGVVTPANPALSGAPTAAAGPMVRGSASGNGLGAANAHSNVSPTSQSNANAGSRSEMPRGGNAGSAPGGGGRSSAPAPSAPAGSSPAPASARH